MDYLKISKATDLEGRDRRLYRYLEMLPGFLSWGTIIGLIILSATAPVGTAVFIILFDVYWLLLVVFLGTHLLISYRAIKKRMNIDWAKKCDQLFAKASAGKISEVPVKDWRELWQGIILPTYNEGLEVIRPSLESLLESGYPTDRMIVVLATEGRAGEESLKRSEVIKEEYGNRFGKFLITVHPDGIEGELKGKGANQAWAAKELKRFIIDPGQIDYKKILVSVFDIDTVVHPGYFHCFTYAFLTVDRPYRASYQPVPVYHNNIWQAPFFARVAAFSNTFWQMMQQIKPEKLATYSSHSMTWQALVDIGFWSTNMVSEDSRIFWHCFCYYKGDYRVEPLYFPVSMDICMDKSRFATAGSLYRQQRRWGWGSENIPYLIFNTIKGWKEIPKKSVFINHIGVQIYGFHSWATNALITSVVGWLPIVLGGDRFNATVLSSNLPDVTRWLMTLAMVGMIVSAVLSVLILPEVHRQRFKQYAIMVIQWLFLPAVIVLFGAIPGLEAQTRLMFGKYMGFWVTPKHRK